MRSAELEIGVGPPRDQARCELAAILRCAPSELERAWPGVPPP